MRFNYIIEFALTGQLYYFTGDYLNGKPEFSDNKECAAAVTRPEVTKLKKYIDSTPGFYIHHSFPKIDSDEHCKSTATVEAVS